MSAAKLSTFIIAKEEEGTIERCLRSVSWADEIIIIDSFSKDNTVDICKKYTDKIYKREFTNFADMKNFALSKVSNEWALSIDADEVTTKALKDEIRKVVDKGGRDVSGFYIKRKSRIFGRWFNFCGTQDDFQMRLFKAKAARYFQPIHEKVSVNGKTAYIKEPLLHYTYESILDYIERLNRYTTIEAEFLIVKGDRPSVFKLCIKPLIRFANLYIFKQGFRDGLEGFLFSALSGFYDFVKYAKLIKTIKKG